jgi:hypothetical protein
MTRTKLLAVALAVLLVAAGTAAAAPGNAPADRTDSADDGDAGPPADLPAPVPDGVAAIHDLILSFIGGDLDGSLGNAVSDATPAGDAEG